MLPKRTLKTGGKKTLKTTSINSAKVTKARPSTGRKRAKKVIAVENTEGEIEYKERNTWTPISTAAICNTLSFNGDPIIIKYYYALKDAIVSRYITENPPITSMK